MINNYFTKRTGKVCQSIARYNNDKSPKDVVSYDIGF